MNTRYAVVQPSVGIVLWVGHAPSPLDAILEEDAEIGERGHFEYLELDYFDGQPDVEVYYLPAEIEFDDWTDIVAYDAVVSCRREGGYRRVRIDRWI